MGQVLNIELSPENLKKLEQRAQALSSTPSQIAANMIGSDLEREQEQEQKNQALIKMLNERIEKSSGDSVAGQEFVEWGKSYIQQYTQR